MNGDEYSYIRGITTAGFIYTRNGTNAFLDTKDEPKIGTMEFPPGYNVCSSEMGLVLLCHFGYGAAHASANANPMYLVSNPLYAGSQRSIPNPPRPHPSPMPHILIAGWDTTRLCLVFHIVCAVQAANLSSYSFDVYSSITDTWESEGTTQVHLGLTIDVNSGVACGTRAYWLLNCIVPTVAYYDIHGWAVGTIHCPEDFPPISITLYPHLGRWGCQLCMVVISDLLKEVSIFTLEQDDRWLRYHDWPYVSLLPLMLSRFQSARLQVPLWCEFWSQFFSENRIMFLENGWRSRKKFRNHDCRNVPRTEVPILSATRCPMLQQIGFRVFISPLCPSYNLLLVLSGS